MSFLKKYYKHICWGLISTFSIAILSGCFSQVSTPQTKKIKVIASLFPQYDFTKQIAGDKVEVSLLLPPGTESHTFDPTPSDIINISNSDIFFYTGKEMEPWVDQILGSIENKNLSICNVSKGISLLKTNHENHKSNNNHSHEHKLDPHIWLDLELATKIVDNITFELCNKDPESSDSYKKNAVAYKNKLLELDENFKDMINNSKRKSLVFAGRFAHLYFIKHYGLNYLSAFDSCSTESEPSVQRIAKIVKFIQDNQIPAIYYEEITEPKIANSISEQTGSKSLKFSTLHNVTKEQLENGVSYIDLMQENFENLRQGLN